MASKIKAKHFTSVEKRFYLEILKKFAHVVESKQSSAAKLSEKEEAWEAICVEFNNSAIVTEKRTVAQLKKLWTNIKQSQREALTRAKQSVLATGGGPQIRSIEIDPDVSAIAPHLLHNTPVVYTSNVRSHKLIERADNFPLIYEAVQTQGEEDGIDHILMNIESEPPLSPAATSLPPSNNPTVPPTTTATPSTSQNHPTAPLPPTAPPSTSRRLIREETSPPPQPPTRRRRIRSVGVQQVPPLEESEELRLKAERIKRIMEMEEEMHQQKMRKMEFEVRTAAAQAELAELLLAKEKAKN